MFGGGKHYNPATPALQLFQFHNRLIELSLTRLLEQSNNYPRRRSRYFSLVYSMPFDSICAFAPIEDEQTPSLNPLNINHPHAAPGVLTLNKPGRRDRGPTNRPVRSRRRYLALPLYPPLVILVSSKHTNRLHSSIRHRLRQEIPLNSTNNPQDPPLMQSAHIREYRIQSLHQIK